MRSVHLSIWTSLLQSMVWNITITSCMTINELCVYSCDTGQADIRPLSTSPSQKQNETKTLAFFCSNFSHNSQNHIPLIIVDNLYKKHINFQPLFFILISDHKLMSIHSFIRLRHTILLTLYMYQTLITIKKTACWRGLPCIRIWFSGM